MDNTIIEKFVKDQLSVWPLAAANFRSLKTAEVKTLEVNGLAFKVQHNPERIVSTSAKIDADSLRARQCFLCADNRMEGQNVLKFDGRKGRQYDIVLNPYPIFPHHLVIVSDRHIPQSIWHNYVDMADLAHRYTDFTFFYNGPKSGASAPDHMHFQACPRGLMPLENAVDALLDRVAAQPSDVGVPNGEEKADVPEDIAGDLEYMASVQEAQLFHYKHFTRGIFALRARTSKSMAKLFYRLLDCVDIKEGDTEPRINLCTWYHSNAADAQRPAGHTHGLADFEYRAIVVLRSRHRSHHYYSEGPDHLTMSPGCADMMGMMVAPHKEDYDKLNTQLLESMLNEVSISEKEEKDVINRLTRTQPTIQVGIMWADEIVFEIISDGAGPQKVTYQEGKIAYNGALYNELYFEAKTLSTLFAEPSFILHDVVIGINFHWERKVQQTFAGSLKFIVEHGKVCAVNVIGVEDYLLSVISSEMKSSATLEFLKAHAVISRSWVMSQVANRKKAASAVPAGELNSTPSVVTSLNQEDNAAEGEVEEYIKWFDHDDHKNFDVCADDHCQRYQGIGMAVGENVRKAIDETWGKVLMWNGEICDCRFYKSCGGKTELFSTCWDDVDYPYLPALADAPDHDEHAHCFCDTHDEEILSQVLNDYDLETKDFYHWTVEYGREELSELVKKRSGIDFGTIQDLIPMEAGPSGRLWKMKIVGSKKTMIIGKELIIRRWLSDSHLKSSAFTVKWEGDKVILDGFGWGHGVGLCQIGAAVMSTKGYNFEEILYHYYPNSELKVITE